MIAYTISKLMFKLPDGLLIRMSGVPQMTISGDRQMDAGTQLVLKDAEKKNMMALDDSKTVDELRTLWTAQLSIIKKPALKGVQFNDREIEVEQASIRVREYIPDGFEANGPAVVHAHGGGFTFMSVDTHHSMMEFLCKELQAKIYSMDYRQAPEHPFPTPLNDVNATYQWVLDHADELEIDANRISISGDSCGGNLATAVCIKRIQEGKSIPKAQMVLCGHLDLNLSSPSYDELAEGYFLTKRHIEFFNQNYVPDAETRKQPQASPFLAPDLSAHPPTVIVTAGFDVLRDEGNDYAKRLKESGVETHHFEYSSLGHAFYMVDFLPAVLKANLEYCAAFKKLI